MLIPYVLPSHARIPDYFIEYDESIEFKFLDDELLVEFKSLTCDNRDCNSTNKPQLIVYSAHITNEERYLQALSDCNLPIDYIKDFLYKG